jgi:hypothetical protein
MSRTAWLVVLVVIVLLITPAAASAQNHGEIGVFGHFFRDSNTDTNFGGLGGRVSFNASTHLQLEADISYDFEQVFTEGFTDPSSGAVSFQESPIRVLHGLFGPKVQTGGGPVRAFLTLKGGFIDFRFDPRPVTFGTFTSSVESLRLENTSGALYPGGGLEAYISIIGLRLDVGDEMYFRSGTHHNWRVTFGPHIRF